MKKSLTHKQKEVLTAIKDIQHKKGSPPSYKELMEVLKYPTASAVQRHTDALKDKGVLTKSRGITLAETSNMVQIPLVGTAPCGQPLLAVENIEAYIAYPRTSLSGDTNQYFFLRGVGDSMNNSDINGKSIDSGDYVLVKRSTSAQPGDRIVALIGDDATIKRFSPHADSIHLEPESTNPQNKPIILFEDILIQGKVVDVIKRKRGENG